MQAFTDSTEVRLERLEAPVKNEYCRLSTVRVPFTATAAEGAGTDEAAAPADPRADGYPKQS